MESERVLVTGAAGFIGAALVRTLVARDSQVHAVVHPRTDPSRLAGIDARIVTHRVDLCDRAALTRAVQKARPALVLHAAARGGHPSDPTALRAAWRDTVGGAAALGESLRSVDVRRVVHLGSSLEYTPRATPLRETDPARPHTVRGVMKAAAALALGECAHASGFTITFVRPFSVYGTGEPAGRLVPTVARALASGDRLRTTSGVFRRDFVHVDDVVAACLRLANCDAAAGATCNVGTGVETSTTELLDIAQVVSGRTLDVCEGGFPARPPDTAHWVADMSHTEALLGWRPEIGLADGLRRVLAEQLQDLRA